MKNPMKLMIAGEWTDELVGRGWLVSEKIDDVRVLWNGEDLITREGNMVRAPAWFLDELPVMRLDGGLYAGRGTFQRMSGIVRRACPVDAEWQDITLQVFDTPDETRTVGLALEDRLLENEIMRVVRYRECPDGASAQKLLHSVTSVGGEGLMFRRVGSPYVEGLTGDLLKLKPYREGVGVIRGWKRGEGELDGLMGALYVEWNGKVIKVGGGFSRDERMLKVPIGEEVEFSYQLLSDAGIPKTPVKIGRYGL